MNIESLNERIVDRQRRNFVGLAALTAIYNFAGGTLHGDLKAIGFSLSFEDPIRVSYCAVAALFWFGWRFWTSSKGSYTSLRHEAYKQQVEEILDLAMEQIKPKLLEKHADALSETAIEDLRFAKTNPRMILTSRPWYVAIANVQVNANGRQLVRTSELKEVLPLKTRTKLWIRFLTSQSVFSEFLAPYSANCLMT